MNVENDIEGDDNSNDDINSTKRKKCDASVELKSYKSTDAMDEGGTNPTATTAMAPKTKKATARLFDESKEG